MNKDKIFVVHAKPSWPSSRPMKRLRESKYSKYEQVIPYEENNLLVFFIFN